MARIKTFLLAGATVTCALALGVYMQGGRGDAGPETHGPLHLSEVKLTAASIGQGEASAPPVIAPEAPVNLTSVRAMPLPMDALAPAALPTLPVRKAVATTPADKGELPSRTATPLIACAVSLTAEPVAAALVNLSLSAPCLPGESVTLHHNGLMFTEMTGPDGTLDVTVPALSETAVFIASFDGGAGAVANVAVPSVASYDRVALQWKGSAGLELHALEFGATYFSDGHVWHDAAGNVVKATEGAGGFSMRVGDPGLPDALIAEIYTYPSAASTRGGEVDLSVEAEVTAANCGQEIEAQTLEFHPGRSLRVQDMTLAIPGCDTVGDFLVLKNIVEDLKIATN